MAGPLRIGVRPGLLALPGTTSAGRTWSNVLPRLAERGAQVVEVDAGAGRWRRPKVDVWLTDGHQGPEPGSTPVVAHLRDAAWTDPELRPLFEPAFLEKHEGPSAAAAAAATRILTGSLAARAQITSAYGRSDDDVDVVPIGVDHDVYRPDRDLPRRIVAGGGGDPLRAYVLFVATVHPRANLTALRDAMAGLARRGFPHALVLVAGPAAGRADAEMLERTARSRIPGSSARVVNLAGATDDEVARLMGGAAAVCLPSLTGGSTTAAAEAMACGAPVVVSDRGALPEVVGDAGRVVPPTAAGIEAALVDLLSDPAAARELRRRGVARAAELTWERTASAVLASLEAAARR